MKQDQWYIWTYANAYVLVCPLLGRGKESIGNSHGLMVSALNVQEPCTRCIVEGTPWSSVPQSTWLHVVVLQEAIPPGAHEDLCTVIPLQSFRQMEDHVNLFAG